MPPIDSEIYPQKVEVSAAGSKTVAQTGRPAPSRYKYGDGTLFYRAGQVIKAEQTARGVLLTCAVNAVSNNYVYTHETALFQPSGADAGGKTLTVEIELWAEGIFRVRFGFDGQWVDRAAGLPPECRMLVAEPASVAFEYGEDEGKITLKTAQITVEIGKDPLCIRGVDSNGKEFFSQYRSAMITSDVLDVSLAGAPGEEAAFEAVTLAEDEEIYGLGERFDGVARKGRAVDFYNKDAIGTTSPRSYVNVPFYLSTRGYGLFLNSSAATEWEIGTADSAALQFAVMDGQMDYFVISGGTPADILKGYCTLTGFSKLPPLWSFGLWMSRNSYITWGVAEEVGREMRAHDIPCDVLHLDTAWFTEDWNCDLRFSKERFPEPEKHLAALKEQGFHVSLWQYNFIPPKANNVNYKEASERGYLAKDGSGGVYRLPETCRGSWVDDAVIDFSNPEAREWYGGQIEQLMRMGAGAIKTDFGEGIPEDACYHAIEGRFYHNLYPLSYNYTVWKATKEATGEDIVWARSGTAGSQRYPLHWGGDSQCTFAGLAGTLRAALSIGISGIPFFSHDIGGFIGLPTAELYVRWAQFGLFSSHSRCHGAGNETYREPWKFGPEAEQIFRKYCKLRYSLMPYIMEQAQKCVRTGLPMVRALYLAYPEDRNVRHIEDQYLFGDDMLIAPVLKPLSETTVREVYLPAGEWIDYWTRDKIVSHGQWVRREVDLDTMPIYVRKGAVLRYCEAQQSLCGGMGEVVKTEEF